MKHAMYVWAIPLLLMASGCSFFIDLDAIVFVDSPEADADGEWFSEPDARTGVDVGFDVAVIVDAESPGEDVSDDGDSEGGIEIFEDTPSSEDIASPEDASSEDEPSDDTSEPPAAPEPTHYYAFSSGSGSVVSDESGGGVDLVMGGDVSWLVGRSGVRIHQNGWLRSTRAPAALTNAIASHNAFTIEWWGRVEAVNQGQQGQSSRARMLTLSMDDNQRNFSVGQRGNKLELRLRTTESPSGQPFMNVDDAVTDDVVHYILRFDGARLAVFINGEKHREDARAGDLSNWDPGFALVLGNEPDGGHQWRGEIYKIALFDEAISGDEIRDRFELGAH
ncbi:MAG: LamG-like jellyroll fold domain-containing protein [Bradymonadaceae bacterium]